MSTTDGVPERRALLERQRVLLRQRRSLNWVMLAVVAVLVINLIVVLLTTWNWWSAVIAVFISGLFGGMRAYHLKRIGERLRRVEHELSQGAPQP
ncbi:hypothetical protein QDR37_14265 [Amnibacterium sp. CER49]|uniref:hypothetical protein n=1 Tax=Amnibacterium sp. CER49 TaxID=3039161 RepID=UPI0024482C0C|nr:hypothetical protein [Amnibacterium sp. CER49]MDH2445114.1 hypothetical protein [Amnibacterium sp. CER49]